MKKKKKHQIPVSDLLRSYPPVRHPDKQRQALKSFREEKKGARNWSKFGLKLLTERVSSH